MPLPSFPEYRNFALNTARGIRQRLADPDDTWPALLLTMGYTFADAVSVEDWLTNKGEELGPLLGKIIRSQGAALAALVVPAVGRDMTAGEVVPKEGLHTLPGSKEILIVQVANKQRYQEWEANIIRKPNELPDLDEWREITGRNPVGNLSEALKVAFKTR